MAIRIYTSQVPGGLARNILENGREQQTLPWPEIVFMTATSGAQLLVNNRPMSVNDMIYHHGENIGMPDIGITGVRNRFEDLRRHREWFNRQWRTLTGGSR